MVQAQKKQLERIERMTLRAKDLRFLCDLDENGDGISEEKFVLSILQHLGKIDHEQDVKPWLEVSELNNIVRVLLFFYCFVFAINLIEIKSTAIRKTTRRW